MDVFDHDHSLCIVCDILVSSSLVVHPASGLYVIIYLLSRYHHFVECQYHRLYLRQKMVMQPVTLGNRVF
ncbi:hypothetical protein BYT27DRAFT_7193359 [Phlegmacium glaucopus]|nr:hypothetical protein BYT27DRAFT_7193359 [Phlegmacium glaucopus]